MTSLSTHVLDTVLGEPVTGLEVVLSVPDGLDDEGRARWRPVGGGRTGPDGRLTDWGAGLTGSGTHRLTFHTGAWFAERDRECFYPEVVIHFTVKDDGRSHCHVPLLLAPFAYSTYRGS